MSQPDHDKPTELQNAIDVAVLQEWRTHVDYRFDSIDKRFDTLDGKLDQLIPAAGSAWAKWGTAVGAVVAGIIAVVRL